VYGPLTRLQNAGDIAGGLGVEALAESVDDANSPTTTMNKAKGADAAQQMPHEIDCAPTAAAPTTRQPGLISLLGWALPTN